MVKLSKVLPACGFVIAVALVGITSAFKDAPKKTLDSYFYQFKDGLAYTQTNIENSENYERSNDACQSGSNVCGVLLPSDATLGDPPDGTEFSTESGNLWLSQQAHSPQNGNIKMRN